LVEAGCTPVFPLTIAAKRLSTYVGSLRVGFGEGVLSSCYTCFLILDCEEFDC
jgi:hypothetical protein